MEAVARVKHGHREKLSATIDPRVYQAVERHAKRAEVTKSRVVEEAIRVWERRPIWRCSVSWEGSRWTASRRSVAATWSWSRFPS